MCFFRFWTRIVVVINLPFFKFCRSLFPSADSMGGFKRQTTGDSVFKRQTTGDSVGGFKRQVTAPVERPNERKVFFFLDTKGISNVPKTAGPPKREMNHLPMKIGANLLLVSGRVYFLWCEPAGLVLLHAFRISSLSRNQYIYVHLYSWR